MLDGAPMVIRLSLHLFVLVLPVFPVAAFPAAEESRQHEVTTFEAILAHALSSSPLVKEIDATLAMRLADALDTRLRLNPQLSAVLGLPVQPAGAANRTQINVVLSQPIRPTDFGVREAVAELISEAASVEQRLSILELSQNVFLSYLKLWILQEQKTFLSLQRQRAQRIRDRVNAAASRGALGKGDSGLFAAEYKKLSAQLLGIEADTARERAKLLRLSTVKTDDTQLKGPDKTLPIPVDSLLQNLDEGQLPIQSRYELLAKVTVDREQVARRDAFPVFSPQITYQQTEDGGIFVGGGLQFELPVFSRNQSEILRRQGEAVAARAQRVYARSDAFREEITQFILGLDAVKKQAEAYEDDVVPSLARALRSYEEEGFAGGGTVLSAWQAQRELTNAQLATLELWTRYFTLRCELSLLTGQQF